MSKSNYEEYLVSIHAKNVTPAEIIQTVVKEGTGENLVSKERIVAGEVNEVYGITLTSGNRVVLRISRSKHPNFLQEKWAIEQVTKVGVPVPKVLLIKYLSFKKQPLSMCLMDKIDGEPLERGLIDFNALGEDSRKSLIVQAGKILSKIHSIKTSGFGWIIGEGKAQYKTVDKLLASLLNKYKTLLEMADKEGISKNDIEKALEVINSFQEAYTKVSPCLNHGDYGHKHFMAKDGTITGILDWGGVRSDTPIYDFANWDYWYGEYIPTEWLKEGYKDKELFDEGFDDFLHMLRLFKGLEVLDWYHREQYKPATEKAKEKLIKDVGYFKR